MFLLLPLNHSVVIAFCLMYFVVIRSFDINKPGCDVFDVCPCVLTYLLCHFQWELANDC